MGKTCFYLAGRVVPKARPRFSGMRAYNPEAYRDWQAAAVTELLTQRPAGWVALTRCQCSMLLTGKHRGDLDNLCGSVLDALVAAGLILDDRLGVVQGLSIQHDPAGPTGCEVCLLPTVP